MNVMRVWSLHLNYDTEGTENKIKITTKRKKLLYWSLGDQKISKHLASSNYHKATTRGQMTKLTRNQFNTSKKKSITLQNR